MIKVNAHAKLNLCLNITGLNGGYHDLESVVVKVALCDTVKIKKRNDDKITLKTSGALKNMPIEKNNAYKSIKLFMEEFKTAGADVKITKRIPIGGGLGGSSADAAGAIAAMSRLYGVNANLKPIAEKVGSDTAFQLRGSFAIMRGKGGDLQYLSPIPTYYVLLSVSDAGVDTGKCYKLYDELEKTPPADVAAMINALYKRDLTEIGKNAINALYIAAKTINPEVERAYTLMRKLSPATAMTGSGASVYSLFLSAKDCKKAKKRLKNLGVDCIMTKTAENVR